MYLCTRLHPFFVPNKFNNQFILSFMKKLFVILLLVASTMSALAQSIERTNGIIEVNGEAKLTVQPDIFFAVITIQETEQKVGYTTIGKTPIDSIKLVLTEALKKYNLSISKHLTLLGTNSREVNNGQLPINLVTLTYSARVSKELARKMVDEMRFSGLKGVMVNWNMSEEKRAKVREQLYELALADAKKSAEFIATKTNRTIADPKSVNVYQMDMTKVDKEYMYDLYNNYRFEYESREPVIRCVLKVCYEGSSK